MSFQNQVKHDEKNGGISPVTAAVTGAIVGASVAVAGALFLKDEKNRKKVKEVVSSVKDQTVDYMDNMQKDVEGKKEEMETTVAEEGKKVKKLTRTAKNALHPKINAVN